MRLTIAMLCLGTLPWVLSGCGTLALGDPDSACSGLPEGISCESARSVYESTHGKVDDAADEGGGNSADEDGAPEADSGASAESDTSPNKATNGARSHWQKAPNGSWTPGASRGGTQPRVMRIWYGPWVNDRGDLQMPNHLYVQVTKSPWQQRGPSRASDGNRRLYPLQDNPGSSAQARQQAPGRGGSGQSSPSGPGGQGGGPSGGGDQAQSPQELRENLQNR